MRSKRIILLAFVLCLVALIEAGQLVQKKTYRHSVGTVTLQFSVGKKLNHQELKKIGQSNLAEWSVWPRYPVIATWLSSPGHSPEEPWRSLAAVDDIRMGKTRQNQVELLLKDNHLVWLPVGKEIIFKQTLVNQEGRFVGTMKVVILQGRPFRAVISWLD